MLLCREIGAVSAEDTDPRLLELFELIDDGRDLCDGIAGSGFCNSLLNSLNILSRPGCIWRAIIGKWFKRSPNDLTSFFRGMDELAPLADELATTGGSALALYLGPSEAGMMGLGSYVPMRGRDMK